MNNKKKVLLIIVALLFIILGALYFTTLADSYVVALGNYSMCLGALLSCLSVILIYKTYREQLKGYQEQSTINQKQLANIQKQIALNQKQFELSERQFMLKLEDLKASYKMQFDSTFFNLLNIHREIYCGCLLRESKNQEDDSVFIILKLRIKSSLENISNLLEHGEVKVYQAKVIVCKIYEFATKPIGKDRDIMHYFRNLYHIIKYVYNSELNEVQKFEYISFVQAQMSDEELLVMLFNVIHYECRNGASPKGFDKKTYFQILDTSHFFENLRPPHEVMSKLMKNLFENELKYIK